MQAMRNNIAPQIFANLVAAALILASLGASAGPQKSQVAAKSKSVCDVCEKSKKNSDQLKKLKYADTEQRFKGEEIANDSVSFIEEFSKMNKSDGQREVAFSGLLTLIREASPYDGEGQLAQGLAELVKQDAGLKADYEKFLKSQPKTPAKSFEACKTQLLQTNVEQNLCMGIDTTKSQDAPGPKADAKTCNATFNFETCQK